jgi:hypothetical protein
VIVARWLKADRVSLVMKMLRAYEAVGSTRQFELRAHSALIVLDVESTDAIRSVDDDARKQNLMIENLCWEE